MSNRQELGKRRIVRETSRSTPEDKWCVRKSVGSSPGGVHQLSHHPAVLDRDRDQRLPFPTSATHKTAQAEGRLERL